MPKQKKQSTKSSRPRPLALLVIAALLVGVGLLAYSIWQANAPSPDAIEFQPLPLHGDKSLLEKVESFPSEGTEHVDGQPLSFNTNPPTSGDHRSVAATAGFYDQPPEPGQLVHSLEHGAIVLYFDPGRATEAEKQSLRAFARKHTSSWASVLVVPAGKYEVPFILTAWMKMLKLENYDAKVVQAFLAEYLGRGPEKPVRPK
jgi:hypothetical protein